MDMGLFQESTDVLRRAFSEDVLDPRPAALQKLDWNGDSILSALAQQLHALRENFEASTWIQKQTTWQLPATRRYVESDAPRELPTTQSQPTLSWLVELARWTVPFGYFGVVKSYEQYLSVPAVQGGENVLSASGRWGDPFPLGITSAAPILRWYLRLSPIQSALGLAWFEAAGAGAIPDRLPGTPYTDLDSTSGLWYPASSPAAHNIHLPVPGGYVLRAFLLAGAQAADAPLSAYLRLTGTIQAETNDSAQQVARESW